MCTEQHSSLLPHFTALQNFTCSTVRPGMFEQTIKFRNTSWQGQHVNALIINSDNVQGEISYIKKNQTIWQPETVSAFRTMRMKSSGKTWQNQEAILGPKPSKRMLGSHWRMSEFLSARMGNGRGCCLGAPRCWTTGNSALGKLCPSPSWCSKPLSLCTPTAQQTPCQHSQVCAAATTFPNRTLSHSEINFQPAALEY